MSRMRPRFLDCTGMTPEEAEQWGKDLCEMQRDLPFWLGDLARFAESHFGESWHQAFPEWASPGMIDRYKGVARAYPSEEERSTEATYTQYRQVANKPDRLKLLRKIVSDGLTSDESRKAISESKAPKLRWLLAVDVNYHLHRHWFSGAGVEAATRVTNWIQRTVSRLKEKGLTDVVCCFESPRNFRKELTAQWEDKYKDRPPKDPELRQQLQLVAELLHGAGYCCATVDGFESDDLLASYAVQFPGRVTILTQDKDLKQCLSAKCNMLLDVEWTEDETSGDAVPEYKWLTAKQHTEATGIRPDQWADFQAIMGDTCDGIKGAPGIGEKGAADLIKEFGTLFAVLEAAKAESDRDEDTCRIKPKKREALLALAERLDVVWQLVTLRTDVEVPSDTRVV